MRNQNTDKKTPLKIACITPGWPLSKFHNGIVTYVHNILYGFDNTVKPIILASPLIGAEIEDKLINLSKFLNKKNVLQKIADKFLNQLTFSYARSIQYRRSVYVNAKKISMALKRISYPLDILEMEESFGTVSFLLKLTKVPIVTRLHGPWFLMGPILQDQDRWDFKLRVFYEGQAIKNAHGITSPSLDVLKKTRQYYGLDLPNAKVIPNPVLEVGINKQWQYSKNKKPYILFVGRFDSIKGGDLILEAFSLIAQKISEIELIFVGPDRGVIVEGEGIDFNQYTERFIPENSIKNRIQYLGHCDHDRISDLRKNALVTVVCSRYENFPLSLLESLAAGCPTVATAVGGMKEIIIDDFNGLLAESESPESIAEKVLMLISDPEKMQRLSKNAIEDCKKRFSPEVVAAQTVEYYQSVLARVSDKSAKN
ncbi:MULTISPECIES: glycosyltransferase family 4 protein [Methylotenera]|uniref:glycosyltransferase family 4 protein n=1 Tax=Methylotenera TaxID=359407 RepID=UPI0003754D4B|nr:MULTISPECIES: glycosyltransferase family 4 protein [Methylotenera]